MLDFLFQKLTQSLSLALHFYFICSFFLFFLSFDYFSIILSFTNQTLVTIKMSTFQFQPTYLSLPTNIQHTYVYIPMSTYLHIHICIYQPTYLCLPISNYLSLPTNLYLPMSIYVYLTTSTYLSLPTYPYQSIPSNLCLSTNAYLPYFILHEYTYLPITTFLCLSTYVYLPMSICLCLAAYVYLPMSI